MRRLIVVIILLVSSLTSYGQYYVNGQDPASIHWRQINTPNFQVIYPDDFEQKAQQVAYILEKVYGYASETLQHQPRKISVILHTKTVHANGFAAWAPARVEMFPTPSQDIYPQKWLEQLAIHEFRHVVQIDKIGEELPGIFKVILGQQAAAAVVGTYLPFWFLEGDAVSTETALSHAGRGRLPSFEMPLRAQVLQKKIYSYDKAYLGSYKNFIPDHYELGYQLVAGARSRYGADVWAGVLDRVARQPLSLTAFDKGLKLATGENKIGLYHEIFNGLKAKWQHQDSLNELTPVQVLSAKPKYFTSYRYPYYVNDSTVVALKTSIDDIDRFVLLQANGKEHKLVAPGPWFRESVTYGNNRIYWVEQKSDVRWQHREFSLLRVYNINRGMAWQRRYHEKVLAPSVSRDGKHLCAVEVGSANQSSILLLSPENGDIIKSFPAPDGQLFLTPSWSQDGKQIFTVVLGDKGKTLAELDVTSGELKTLMPYSYVEIRRPVQQGNYLFYASAQTGIDNIFALDLTTGENFQVTSSRFGIRDIQFSPNGKKLLYADYSANGFRAVQADEDSLLWKKSQRTEEVNMEPARTITEQGPGAVELNEPDSALYPSTRYSKPGHLFNIHSWAPVYVNTTDYTIHPGVSVMSQNKLSSMIAQFGYDYSVNDKEGKWYANLEYEGWFPIFKLETSFGKQKSQYYQVTNYTNQAGQVVRSDTSLVDFSWNQWNIDLDARIPLDLSRGKWYRLLQPEAKMEFTSIQHNSTTPSQFFSGSIVPITYRLYFHNLLRQSIRDLQPRWGQIVDFSFRHTPFGNLDYGTAWSAEGYEYLPGFFRHHGVRVYGGYQRKELSATGNMLSDLILYPRGYKSFSNRQLFTLRTDYTLPLLYPDWNLGRWIYLKRINLRGFYDYGWTEALASQNNQTINYNFSFQSYGAEVTTNCHFLRFKAPANLGVRYSYMPDLNDYRVDVIFSINFSAL